MDKTYSIPALRTYTLEEASDQFFKGATARHLASMIKNGELKAKKVGGKWIMTESAIADFFNYMDNNGCDNAADETRKDSKCQSMIETAGGIATLPHQMGQELTSRLKLVRNEKRKKCTTK